MRKFMLTVMVMSLSVFVLVGCAKTDKSDTTTTTKETTVEKEVVDKPVVDKPAMEGDIVDIASADPNFSTLVAALTKAQLVDTLKGEGPFTVFAPTNAAFEKLLMDLGITADELLAHPDLAKVLTYHVVPGKVMSTDLTDKMEADTVNGEKLKVDLTDGVMINNAKVTTADLEASNGVIHVIDTVLVPADFKLK